MPCRRIISLALLIIAVICCPMSSGMKCSENGFLLGGDISMADKMEQLGAGFRSDGRKKDLIYLLKDYGCNCLRLRLFVKPNYKNAVVNDLPYTLKLGKRIKNAGMKLLLDFHYSDTWADPSRQLKPGDWQTLDFEALEKQVENYTGSVMKTFKKNGALPDIVQIGNEIAPGFLWPDGQLHGEKTTEAQWLRFTRLLKAGIKGARSPLEKSEAEHVRIMIHIHCGGNPHTTRWFFENVLERKVPFDIIGLSYYPWWHGTMNDLRSNLRETAKTFEKDIIVVETAYPFRNQGYWKEKKAMAWPISREGQRAFLDDLITTVKETPNNRGRGVLYWYPESIPVKGLRVWNGGATALFDEDGNCLPSLEVFRNAWNLVTNK